MMLLSRLEEKNAHLRKERVMKTLQKDAELLYAAMKETLENTHIVDASGLYKVITSFYNTASVASAETHGATAAYSRQKQPRGTQSSSSNVKMGVTMVSQCSVNHLAHLASLSERWKGPISVAVFAPDAQSVDAAIDYLLHLYQCAPSVRENVSVHLVYPLVETLKDLPESRPMSQQSLQCNNLASPASQKLAQSRNYAFPSNTKYPNNLLRNVAISNAQTEFVFVIDIDMLPSANLHRNFVDFAQRHYKTSPNRILEKDTAFVIPAFELQNGVPIPKDKKSLLQLWKQREVRPFYYEMCWRCQKPTDYDAWRNLSASSTTSSLASALSIGYEVEWKDPWEPFYIGTKSMPRYDERFKQYGFNRISQVSHVTHIYLTPIITSHQLLNAYKTLRLGERHGVLFTNSVKN